MDTRLLRSFLAVAQLNSFTEAALELGYTQSTVTSHVQKLERQLGGPLLDRLPSGTVVTEFGTRVVRHAQDVVDAEDRLREASRSDPARPSGTVRLIAPESLCAYRLPEVISAVREAEPDVQVWLSPGGIGDALDAVRRGTVDLALSMEPEVAAADLTVQRLGTEPLIFLEHKPTAGRPMTWRELARRDALLIEEGCGYSDDVANRLAATGEPAGRRARFGSVEAIKRSVAVGLGWTVLPAVTVEAELRSGELAMIDGPPLPDCDVRAITHPRRHRSQATAVVLSALSQCWAPAGHR